MIGRFYSMKRTKWPGHYLDNELKVVEIVKHNVPHSEFLNWSGSEECWKRIKELLDEVFCMSFLHKSINSLNWDFIIFNIKMLKCSIISHVLNLSFFIIFY